MLGKTRVPLGVIGGELRCELRWLEVDSMTPPRADYIRSLALILGDRTRRYF